MNWIFVGFVLSLFAYKVWKNREFLRHQIKFAMDNYDNVTEYYTQKWTKKKK